MDRKRKREWAKALKSFDDAHVLTCTLKGELRDLNTRAWAGERGTFFLLVRH